MGQFPSKRRMISQYLFLYLFLKPTPFLFPPSPSSTIVDLFLLAIYGRWVTLCSSIDPVDRARSRRIRARIKMLPIVISWTALRRELPLPNTHNLRNLIYGKDGISFWVGCVEKDRPPPRSRDCFRGKLYFSGLLPTVGGEWNWFCSEKERGYNGDAPIRRGKTQWEI